MRFMSTKIALVALGVALAASGCATKSSTANSSARAITIVTPAAGATVTNPVHITLSVTGAQIGTPESGRMHFHIHVDGSTQYAIVYSTSVTIPVAPGQHTFKVVLAEPNHAETSTTSSITLQVSGAGGSPGPSPTSTSRGYGY